MSRDRDLALRRIRRLTRDLEELELRRSAAIAGYCELYGRGSQVEAAEAAGVTKQAISHLLRVRRQRMGV
jgi:hypothetical protein